MTSQPLAYLIFRVDSGPVTDNIPTEAVLPLHLGDNTSEAALADTDLILSDFGEAFEPASAIRPCEDCQSPLAARPSEARFEPQSPLSFSADIWTLEIALWKSFAMKPLSSDEFVNRTRW